MSESILHVDCLGVLQARIGRDSFALKGAKSRSLLAILALNAGRCVHRDYLIDELDLSGGTCAPVNALHASVARLRRRLVHHAGGRNVLRTVDSGYLLSIEHDQVDARSFIAQTEKALRIGTSTPTVAAAMLEDALRLWRGAPLQDVYDGPFLGETAQDLNRLRATAREELIGAWMQLDEFQRVAVHARRFLADDPLNERLHADLVLSLKMLGRNAESIEAFRFAERTLRQELGVMPGPLLRDAGEYSMDRQYLQQHNYTARPRQVGAR